MISFTAPSTSTFFDINTTFNVDILPTRTKGIALIEQNFKDLPLTQRRPDGINTIAQQFSFKIMQLPIATLIKLDGYFNELNGSSPILFTLTDASTLTATVDSWVLNIDNALYGGITAEAMKVYP